MSEDVIPVRHVEKAKLIGIKEQHGFKSLNDVIRKLCDLYRREYTRPEDILIEELNKVQDKYHYLLTSLDKEIFCLYIASIRAPIERKQYIFQSMLERILLEVEKDKKLDQVLSQLAQELAGKPLVACSTEELRAIHVESRRRYPELCNLPRGVRMVQENDTNPPPKQQEGLE